MYYLRKPTLATYCTLYAPHRVGNESLNEYHGFRRDDWDLIYSVYFGPAVSAVGPELLIDEIR